LGELSALAAAGALSVEDGLRLAALRGRLTDQAAQAEAAGGLLVVEGASPEVVGKLGEAHGLVVAADNAPSQAVLSGGRDRLREVAWRARAAGLTTRPVNVCGAFHSPQLRLAADQFRVVLEQVQFRAPRVPVICSLTARPIDDPPKRLAQGLTEPVLWRQTLLALHRWGARRFIDIGPGRVLLGLARRTLPRDVELTAADSTASARTR
jgi:[acyl-carrier-protein] S-malonyltransferase